MDIKSFLNLILPRQGIYMAVGIDPSGRTRHDACVSIDELASKLLQLDNSNTSAYHACASYLREPYIPEGRTKKVFRVKENWAYARSFWIDIDVGLDKAEKGLGYATQMDAIKALAAFCKKATLPTPLLISSGYGVHAYFIMDTDMTPEQWVPVATVLKQLLQKAGVLADPSRTADFASILRPVGTHNHKHGANKPVEVLLEGRGEVPFERFRQHMEGLAQRVLQQAAEAPSYMQGQVTALADTTYPEYKFSADLCADKCAQVRQVRDTKGDANYEHWRGVIGLLKHCENGEKLAVEWTSRRAETGHSNVDVQTRWETWSSGPTTCAFFQSCNPDGCNGCPFNGQINTPLMLGRLDEVKPEIDEEDDPVLKHAKAVAEQFGEQPPMVPAGFQWTGVSLVRFVEDKKGVTNLRAFSQTFFHVVGRVRDSNGESYQIRAFDPHKPRTYEDFILPGEVVSGGKDLSRTLSKHGIHSSVGANSDLDMVAYIKQSVFTIRAQLDAVHTATTFGWQQDGSIVIGERQYHPDGVCTSVRLAEEAKKHLAAFPAPSGTLEGYAEALNAIYNRDGMEPMQYAICSVWGSLLVSLSNSEYHGIPCVLSGAESGKGKTTAARAALFAFGNADSMKIHGFSGATYNAMTARLATMKDFPLLFDEMTNGSQEAFSRLLYSLSSGTERERLQSVGGRQLLAQRLTWSSQSVMTGNTDIGSVLTASDRNADAESMRLFEINIDEYVDLPTIEPIGYVAQQLETMSLNQGVAGEQFVKFLIANRDKVALRLTDVANSVGTDNKDVANEPKYRFYRYHMACTLVAARIMKHLGVISFDLDKLRAFAEDAAAKLAKRSALQSGSYVVLVKRILDDLLPWTVYTPSFQSGAGKPKLQPVAEQRVRDGIVKVRVVRSDENDQSSNPLYRDCVLIEVSSIRNWLEEHREVSPKRVRKELEAIGAFREYKNHLTLSSGCLGMKDSYGPCWILDYNKLYEDEASSDEDF